MSVSKPPNGAFSPARSPSPLIERAVTPSNSDLHPLPSVLAARSRSELPQTVLPEGGRRRISVAIPIRPRANSLPLVSGDKASVQSEKIEKRCVSDTALHQPVSSTASTDPSIEHPEFYADVLTKPFKPMVTSSYPKLMQLRSTYGHTEKSAFPYTMQGDEFAKLGPVEKKLLASQMQFAQTLFRLNIKEGNEEALGKIISKLLCAEYQRGALYQRCCNKPMLYSNAATPSFTDLTDRNTDLPQEPIVSEPAKSLFPKLAFDKRNFVPKEIRELKSKRSELNQLEEKSKLLTEDIITIQKMLTVLMPLEKDLKSRQTEFSRTLFQLNIKPGSEKALGTFIKQNMKLIYQVGASCQRRYDSYQTSVSKEEEELSEKQKERQKIQSQIRLLQQEIRDLECLTRTRVY